MSVGVIEPNAGHDQLGRGLFDRGHDGWRVLAVECHAGECPTIYQADEATIVVQGYELDPADVGLEPHQRTGLVEIPARLLDQLGGLVDRAGNPSVRP